MPQELANQLSGARLSYWGGIVEGAGTSGPPYVGAVICFLALLGFFVLGNKHKWWMLGAMIMAILMSWGHYFEGFNTFLLNNLPMYNKFRAPSMALVIPTFILVTMAILTLQKIISDTNKGSLWKEYKKGLMLTGGIFVVLLLIYMSADFTGEVDRQLLSQTASAPDQVKGYINAFLDALKEDRKSLFFGSLTRAFLFMAAAAFMIWLTIRKNVMATITLVVIGLLAFIDIMSVDSKYLNSENYQDEMENDNAFFPTQADTQIMQDTSYYRVFDLRQGLGTLT